MAKLIILSIVLYMSIFPVVMARRSSPKRTLRTIQIVTLVVVFLWALACRIWYPQLVPLE
jgi:hypothetical protein